MAQGHPAPPEPQSRANPGLPNIQTSSALLAQSSSSGETPTSAFAGPQPSKTPRGRQARRVPRASTRSWGSLSPAGTSPLPHRAGVSCAVLLLQRWGWKKPHEHKPCTSPSKGRGAEPRRRQGSSGAFGTNSLLSPCHAGHSSAISPSLPRVPLVAVELPSLLQALRSQRWGRREAGGRRGAAPAAEKSPRRKPKSPVSELSNGKRE